MIMAGLIRRAVAIYRKGGIDQLLRKSGRFTHRIGLSAYSRLTPQLTPLTLRRTVGSTSARFRATNPTIIERLWDLKGEREVIGDLLGHLRDGDIFFDIGANIGVYSCFVGNQVDDIDVVMFEPHPENAREAKANCDRNSIAGTNYEVALSDVDEQATLEVEGGGRAGVGKHRLGSNGPVETISVPVRRGDSLRNDQNLPAPTVVKIDVEGAEVSVLRGLQETLTDPNCRLVYCELHPDLLESQGHDETVAYQLLENAGFTITEVGTRGTQRHLRGKKE